MRKFLLVVGVAIATLGLTAPPASAGIGIPVRATFTGTAQLGLVGGCPFFVTTDGTLSAFGRGATLRVEHCLTGGAGGGRLFDAGPFTITTRFGTLSGQSSGVWGNPPDDPPPFTVVLHIERGTGLLRWLRGDVRMSGLADVLHTRAATATLAGSLRLVLPRR